MIQASQLAKSYPGRPLFSDVSFVVGKSEKIGLVGRNGTGKSTLVKIILKQESADEGKIIIPKNYNIGCLDQHIHFEEEKLLEEVCRFLPEELSYEAYRAEKILFGLGFNQKDMEKDPKEFSGGFQLRIQLAKALVAEPSLLLLDEPTNYLDIQSLVWMKRFLKTYDGEVLLITHDRAFMESVVTHTMGIHREKLKKIKGGPSKYYTQLMIDEDIYIREKENTDRKKQELQKFVDRFGAKASKAAQAQSKLKQLQKLGNMEELGQIQNMGFKFSFKETPAKKLMSCEKLQFGFNPDQPLFKGVGFELKKGERIAIVGPNGKGKTTLLNVLAKQLTAQTGEINLHPETVLGYYQQTNRKDLNPKSQVLEEIQEENVSLSLTQVRAICGAMMFPGAMAEKRIEVLSGGEQSRVLLGKVLAKPCNVLLLDEPTNHLDMESIQGLKQQIKSFQGGVIFVTHDEDVLHDLATSLVVFRKNSAQFFKGTYKEFLSKFGWEESNGSDDVEADEPEKTFSTPLKELKKRRRPFEKIIQNAEEKILKFEQQLEEKQKNVEKLLAEDPKANLANEYMQIGQLQKKIDKLFVELSEATEKLEAIV